LSTRQRRIKTDVFQQTKDRNSGVLLIRAKRWAHKTLFKRWRTLAKASGTF